jgi:Fe-S-cluster containining protein
MSRPEHARKATTGLRFECTQCGKCCTRRGKYAHVYLNTDEIRRLAAATGTSVRKFRRRYTFVDGYGWTQLQFRGDSCPFLDPGSNACTVYEARPVQCRTFPFWGGMIGARGWTREARSLCEGVGHGAVHPASAVEASIREMEEAD